MQRVDLLLVDDEPGLREGLAEFLSGEGFSLDQAATEEEAISKAESGHPGVVLADFRLESGNGISLFSRLKQIQDLPQPSCILMTGYASLDNAVDAIRAGAEDYLLKPICLPELGQAVRSGLARARGRERERLSPGQGLQERIYGQISAPLTVLRAYLDMFGEGRFGPMTAVQDAKWDVLRRHMDTVVRALRDIHLPAGPGQLRGELSLEDPQALLREAKQGYFLDFERRGVHVVLEMPSSPLGRVLCGRREALALLEAVLGSALGMARFGMTLRVAWNGRGTGELELSLSLSGTEGRAMDLQDWIEPVFDAASLAAAGLSFEAKGPDSWKVVFRERKP